MGNFIQTRVLTLCALISFLFSGVQVIRAQDVTEDEKLYPTITEGVPKIPFERTGTSGWQFLKLPTDARMAALAGMFTGIYGRGGAHSGLTNPAGTADVTRYEVAFSYMDYISDVTYNAASFVKNFDTIGRIGINWIGIYYGTMKRTSFQIQEVNGVPVRSVQSLDEGTFSGGDLAIGLTYGNNVTDRLKFGISAKYIKETLDDGEDISTSGWAIDVGTVYYTGIRSLRISLLGRNFGPDNEFTQFDDRIGVPPAKARLPMSFQAGAAMDLIEDQNALHALTVAVEFLHLTDAPERFNFGAEYGFRQMLFLRAGYKTKLAVQGITLGGGLNVITSTLAISVDYAYNDYSLLGNTHLVSVALSPGK